MYGARIVHGVVAEVTETSLKLRSDEGPTVRFTISKETKVRVDEKDAGLAELLKSAGRRAMVMTEHPDSKVAFVVEIFSRHIDPPPEWMEKKN